MARTLAFPGGLCWFAQQQSGSRATHSSIAPSSHSKEFHPRTFNTLPLVAAAIRPGVRSPAVSGSHARLDLSGAGLRKPRAPSRARRLPAISRRRKSLERAEPIQERCAANARAPLSQCGDREGRSLPRALRLSTRVVVLLVFPSEVLRSAIGECSRARPRSRVAGRRQGRRCGIVEFA